MKIASGSDRSNKRTNYRKVWVNKKETFPVSTLKEKQELKNKNLLLKNQKLKSLDRLSKRVPILYKNKTIVHGFKFFKPQKPRNPITQIKIRLVSPKEIYKWCSRILPDGRSIGEIKNAQTVDYKTLDPKKDGLFCERIFGPVEDFRCICDKTRVKKKDKENWNLVRRGNKVCYICQFCEVESAPARVRRYNLGYIQLNSSVTHIWFLKGRISYISILLGYKRKDLEQLTFCYNILDFTENKIKQTFFFSDTYKITYTKSLFLENSSISLYTSRLRFSKCKLKMEEKSKNAKFQQHRLLSVNIYENIGTFCFNLFKFVLPKGINLNKLKNTKDTKPPEQRGIPKLAQSKGKDTAIFVPTAKRHYWQIQRKLPFYRLKKGTIVEARRGYYCYLPPRRVLPKISFVSPAKKISPVKWLKIIQKAFYTKNKVEALRFYRKKKKKEKGKPKYSIRAKLKNFQIKDPKSGFTNYSGIKWKTENLFLIKKFYAKEDTRDSFYNPFYYFKKFYKKPIALLFHDLFSFKNLIPESFKDSKTLSKDLKQKNNTKKTQKEMFPQSKRYPFSRFSCAYPFKVPYPFTKVKKSISLQGSIPLRSGLLRKKYPFTEKNTTWFPFNKTKIKKKTPRDRRNRRDRRDKRDRRDRRDTSFVSLPLKGISLYKKLKTKKKKKQKKSVPTKQGKGYGLRVKEEKIRRENKRDPKVGTKQGKGYVLRVKEDSRKKGYLTSNPSLRYPKVGRKQGKGYVLRVKEDSRKKGYLTSNPRDRYPKVGTKQAISLPLRVKGVKIRRDTCSNKRDPKVGTKQAISLPLRVKKNSRKKGDLTSKGVKGYGEILKGRIQQRKGVEAREKQNCISQQGKGYILRPKKKLSEFKHLKYYEQGRVITNDEIQKSAELRFPCIPPGLDFLQPTICPFLPEIVERKFDFREDLTDTPLESLRDESRAMTGGDNRWSNPSIFWFFTQLFTPTNSYNDSDFFDGIKLFADFNPFSHPEDIIVRIPSSEIETIPIPEYSQKTPKKKTALQRFYSLSNQDVHQHRVANTGGVVIRQMLKQLNLRILVKLLKKIILKTEKQIHKTELKIQSGDEKLKIFPLRKPIQDQEEVEYIDDQKSVVEWRLKRLNRFLKKLKIYYFKNVRCAKITRDFINSKVQPEWMTLCTLPVLPPNLRPIIQLDGNQIAVSDLNKIYQTIFYRNNRIVADKSRNSLKTGHIKKQFLLQKAVNALIDNGKGGNQSMCALNGRPLKSLSDILKGKKGRFRLTLLGKRVDYSGRSVIVVGPTLKVHQCGLPKEMAIELFKPFLIRSLFKQEKVQTIVEAKILIAKKNEIVWLILEDVMRKHFVFLNRAPTLHRLGIQGFQPKLVNGRAILLHPLVCTAFNADFDGDQLAVHIPLSFKAQAEARILMSPMTNILSPATGQPILVPSQDMILGCNYLTYLNSLPSIKGKQSLISLSLPGCIPYPYGKKQNNNIINFESFFSISSHTGYFSDFNDLLKAYYQKKIDLHAPVWVRTNLSIETEKTSLSPLEMRIYSFGEYNQLFSTFQLYYNRNGQKVKQYLFTTPGRVLVNQIFFG